MNSLYRAVAEKIYSQLFSYASEQNIEMLESELAKVSEEALEEAAKVAENADWPGHTGDRIAKAIRALKLSGKGEE